MQGFDGQLLEITKDLKNQILTAIENMANQALRTIIIAQKHLKSEGNSQNPKKYFRPNRKGRQRSLQGGTIGANDDRFIRNKRHPETGGARSHRAVQSSRSQSQNGHRR